MWHDQEIVMRQREREYRSLIDKVEDLREEYQKLASRGTSFDFRMSEDRARSAMLKDSVSHLGDYARKVAQIQTEEAAAYLKSFYEWVWLHIYSVSDGGLYDVFNAVRLRERIVSAVSDLGESTGLDLLIEAMNRDDAINVVRAAVEVLEKRVMNTSSISAYQSGEVRSALRAALKKDEQESQRFRDSGYPADMASHKKAILAMLEKIG
jgi:HEAT repeat protein